MNTRARHPAGTPTGGQFAAGSNPEADLDLAEPPGAASTMDEIAARHASLRTMPAHVVITATVEAMTDRPPTRLMARDIPCGPDRTYARRFTNLDHGTEWFIEEDPESVGEYHRIVDFTVKEDTVPDGFALSVRDGVQVVEPLPVCAQCGNGYPAVVGGRSGCTYCGFDG